MAYEKSDGPGQKKSKAARMTVLVLILIFSTFLGFIHIYPMGGWTPPPIDSFCPFGGIESAFSLIFTGKMLQRIAWSSFVLLLATLIVAFLFRRSFCGNICPLGTLQELVRQIREEDFWKALRGEFRDRQTRPLFEVCCAGRFCASHLDGRNHGHTPLRPLGGLSPSDVERPFYGFCDRIHRAGAESHRIPGVRQSLLQIPVSHGRLPGPALQVRKVSSEKK